MMMLMKKRQIFRQNWHTSPIVVIITSSTPEVDFENFIVGIACAPASQSQQNVSA
jgi:hypothetical protein